MRFSTDQASVLGVVSTVRSKTSAVNGKITTQENEMKTRQELILDFMLALSSNPAMMDSDSYNIKDDANYIHQFASFLADKYLENI